MRALEPQAGLRQIEATWERSIVPALEEYIRIPNKSPAFDPRWAEKPHMEQAVGLIAEWCGQRRLDGLALEVVRLPGRTPLVFMEVPATGGGTSEDCVLLYGHLDKQPEMEGWRDGLGPWSPRREGERLYGRGGADDGYAAFASLAALEVLAEQGLAHARAVIVIEACEESGSFDLPHYIEALAPRIGRPSLVICLDSGCGDYERMWCTTSLRGLVGGTLSVELIGQGVHSGDASGVVPSSFRVARALLERIERAETGAIRADFEVAIPAERRHQAARAAEVLGAEVHARFPFHPGARPVTDDLADLVLNRTWRSGLEVIGAGGLPALADAGNVMRPRTALKLSLRIPPTLDAEQAAARLRDLLEADPPYGARVRFEPDTAAGGWNAPALSPWLEASAAAASRAFFGRGAVYMGEGGAIPFMGMLGARFPDAQFLISGVLGPQSNAHGPNEFLHLPTAKRLTGCVARIVADHRSRAEQA